MPSPCMRAKNLVHPIKKAFNKRDQTLGGYNILRIFCPRKISPYAEMRGRRLHSQGEKPLDLNGDCLRRRASGITNRESIAPAQSLLQG